MVNFKHEQNENPGSVCDFRGFLFHLCKVAYAFRLLLSVVTVQPFVNVVANYIRHNRNKKCGAYFAHETSPPFCWRGDSIYNITYIKNIQYFTWRKLENTKPSILKLSKCIKIITYRKNLKFNRIFL